MSTTTVGAKKVEEPAGILAAELDKSEAQQTVTNWNALVETGLKPEFIRCAGYFPVHTYDNGCHTTLQLNPKQMIAHLDGEHGGGLFISFRENFQNDHIGARTVRVGKGWQGWKEFEAAGIELRDLRCDHCGEEVKLAPRSILRHTQRHQGKNSKSQTFGDFWLTLSREYVSLNEEDE